MINSSATILTEQVSPVELLFEGEGANKQLYLTGLLTGANVKNANGRVYPLPTLEKEMKRFVQENVKTNRAFGTLGHDPSTSVDPSKICLVIKEITQKGSEFYGKCLVPDTQAGKLVRALVDAGASLGISTRGLGELKKLPNGLLEVQPNYRLLSIDLVCSPSHPNAYLTPTYEEEEE